MAGEGVVLDPDEVAVERTELDLNLGGIKIMSADYGTADIVTQLANRKRGASMVDFSIPPRPIELGLKVEGAGGTTYGEAFRNLQQKVARMQEEGGWLKRQLNPSVAGMFGIDAVYADIITARLTIPANWITMHREVAPDVLLELDAVPDFYGDEIDHGDNVGTNDAELIFTETGIKGDFPGRMRLVVGHDAGQMNMLGLLVAMRSRTYSPDATARLAYEAEALTPMGGAAVATLSGGLGGGTDNVVTATLVQQWQAILSSEIDGVGHMTHHGSYRMWARVYDAAQVPGNVSLRLEHFVGDAAMPTLGPVKTTNVGAAFSLVDLGQVTIGKVKVGPQRWEWRILAKAAANGAVVHIDRVWLFPLDEGYAKVVRGSSLPSPTSFAIRGDFTVNGGLSGKALEAGTGTWGVAGDADGLTVAAGIASRTAVSDAAGFQNGHFAIAGSTNFAAVQVSVDVRFNALLGQEMAVFCRYIDPSNFLLAYISAGSVIGSSTSISLLRRVGGTTTNLADVQTPLWPVNVWHTIRLLARASGELAVWATPAGQEEGRPPAIMHADPAAKTGGGLASGKTGIFDQHTVAGAVTRDYRNYRVSVPEDDAVLFVGRSGELRSDGYYRQDSAGVAYSEIPVLGDLPRTPPAGSEGRTLEVMVKVSQGDFESLADPSTDNPSGRLYYRPSWLFLPEPD